MNIKQIYIKRKKMEIFEKKKYFFKTFPDQPIRCKQPNMSVCLEQDLIIPIACGAKISEYFLPFLQYDCIQGCH